MSSWGDPQSEPGPFDRYVPEDAFEECAECENRDVCPIYQMHLAMTADANLIDYLILLFTAAGPTSDPRLN